MKRVAIIGVGLIGGSLGLALKKRGGARRRWKIIGAGRHEERLRLARKLGAIDAFTTNFTKAAMESDIIVICAPVGKIAGIIRKIISYAKPGAVITDAGSVKLEIVEEAERAIKSGGRKDIFFVGAHPLAGLEKAGVENAGENLFAGATVVLTPVRGRTGLNALKEAAKLWRGAGANIEIMSPEMHDKLVAATSHLPHVLSAALVSRISTENTINPLAAKLIAGSFTDMTRISGSDPENWAEICRMNSKNLLAAIESYIVILKNAAKIIRKPSLKKYFERARKERWQLLKSNQKKK